MRKLAILMALLLLVTACVRIDPVNGFSFGGSSPGLTGPYGGTVTALDLPAGVVPIEDPGGASADVTIRGYKLGSKSTAGTIAPGKSESVYVCFQLRSTSSYSSGDWEAVPSVSNPHAYLASYSAKTITFDGFYSSSKPILASSGIYVTVAKDTPRSVTSFTLKLRLQKKYQVTPNEREVSITIPITHPPDDFAVDGLEIDDASQGNGDGMLSPGERATVKVRLKNQGAAARQGVSLKPSLTDSNVSFGTYTAPTISYGSIEAGAIASPRDGIDLKVSSSAPTSQPITLQLSVTDAAGLEWNLSHPLSLAPNPAAISLEGYETPGAASLVRGQFQDVRFLLKNTGTAKAKDVYLSATESNTYVSLYYASNQYYGDLLPGASALPSGNAVEVYVNSSAPANYTFTVTLKVEDALGGSWTFPVTLTAK